MPLRYSSLPFARARTLSLFPRIHPRALGAPLINHNYVSRGADTRLRGNTKNYTAGRILIVRDESIYGAISGSYRDRPASPASPASV